MKNWISICHFKTYSSFILNHSTEQITMLTDEKPKLLSGLPEQILVAQGIKSTNRILEPMSVAIEFIQQSKSQY